MSSLRIKGEAEGGPGDSRACFWGPRGAGGGIWAGSRRGWLERFLLLGSSLAKASTPCVGAQAKAEDRLIMATYVFHCVSFTTWPEDAFSAPGDPYRLVIAGQDPFGPRIDEVMRREKVRGRGLSVRRSRSGDGLEGVHLVFVGEGDEALMRRVIAAVAERPVLTVGLRAGFCAAGGMVTFRTERARIGLEIHLAAVKRARLHMDSRILDVATLYPESGDR